MSAIESDDEGELFNGFGSSPIPSTSSLKPTKRWSFHNNTKPNLVDLPSEASTSQRRLSDITGEDNVHKEIDPMNPALSQIVGGGQLYSTESGRLFHAGKICIALAGLPGRGKTHLSVSLTRYLRWLGVKTHSFHLGNYRRAKAESDLDHVLFVPLPDSPKANDFRKVIVDECVNDILNFFKHDKGQVAIYDAVNALPEYRTDLHKKLTDLNIQVLFIESLVTDDSIIMKNMEEAARSSPDYLSWDYDKAYKDYSERIKFLTPYYQEMGGKDVDLSYIKFINFGERIQLHNSNYGYLINKVVFFLMNSRIKLGSVFFARCYKNSLDYTSDPPLDAEGLQYAKNVTETLFSHLKSQGKDYVKEITSTRPPAPKRQLSVEERHPAAGVDGVSDDSIVVWTSTKKRTIETTQFFAEKNIKIRHRIQLSQKNPGVLGTLSNDEIKEKFPDEYEHYIKDPYHYRFSRAESYHDLALKIEPLILEMERMSGDILIIADETVLKVLYGYLLSCSCYDIPYLNFLSEDIIEIKFNAYSNTAERIPIKSFP
ncbi:bifunctional 6-phosphofructo-2-kinase/fructose-2,6-bisphosphate 2-phosphatase [Suhomyces tanzawaensis NRRL Y-17324]|uniref:Bifunctional 6-phosphofructo-2-kinase/fructose-2,6-bisphosphate 2-phosphatase n=1 Tax=Suhomyces tanzawaensis NRRL Y-17324 TaxID=984487 RepID=A0A1E4SD27_9ASCO|nr:bifunctional 6-phosphofructo-2-kinase/fructose-2,6-bisphosphate 2-phosphatase [Suhomyces tanzawaensis NRRL Y-17324]ODV77427.1 bifunctional 6-phosphofructo-2-kinase/fructose-2,6-bisphosphate 2-phosphatase [Suhomyces tanzawaensis NRRL Y-17324]